MRWTLLILAGGCLAAFAQGPRATKFEGRDALLVANDKIELTVFSHGGAIVSVVLRDDPDKNSPIWNPIRLAGGGDRNSFGHSVGHFVCVDGFGPVSPEEKEAGLPGHGEACTLPWETKLSRKDGTTSVLTQAVKLPLVQETLTRTIRLADGENVILVESELENLLAFDRPVNWAEHATIGSPFLDPGQTVVDMPAFKAQVRPHETAGRPLPEMIVPGKDFRWPMAPGTKGGKVDVRLTPKNPNSLDHTTCNFDPARKLVYVTALHTGKHLILGYVFKREEFPWVQSWMHFPPDGKMARGLEFSTQPYDVPRREAIGTATMFDTPTYRWLPAKGKIGARFLMFWARAPEGMTRVDDVRLDGGRLIVEDKKSRKQLTLVASLGL